MEGKMKEKMKRDRDERKDDFFQKNVSGPSNPPDELAQMFRKNPRRTNYSSIFPSKVQNLFVFSKYLHDSNSIFRARGINSEIFSGGTVFLTMKVLENTPAVLSLGKLCD